VAKKSQLTAAAIPATEFKQCNLQAAQNPIGSGLFWKRAFWIRLILGIRISVILEPVWNHALSWIGYRLVG
jgi:hypothetical protein